MYVCSVFVFVYYLIPCIIVIWNNNGVETYYYVLLFREVIVMNGETMQLIKLKVVVLYIGMLISNWQNTCSLLTIDV